MGASIELSNIQKELLKLYAHNVSDDQLSAIKKMLAEFFAREIDRQMDELWNEKSWGDEKIEEWKQGHFRTPYNA
jgi:hypothetical protein